jgi:hypothetical protein
MVQRLSWNWLLFWRVFAATVYFHLSVEVTLLVLLFLSLFGELGDWAWLAYPLWVINLYPATRAAQWASPRYRQIAFWHRARAARSDSGDHTGSGHATDP